MNGSGVPSRRQASLANRGQSSIPSAKSSTTGVGKMARPKTHPPVKNGAPAFSPSLFLAKAGLGRKVVNLKKGEVAYAQGDPADALFYVKSGQLRVSVTSSNGKEATLALAGAGEFVGESCMVSSHPFQLATATAMADCTLLRISKVE